MANTTTATTTGQAPTRPVVYMAPDIWNQLIAYTKLCESEISGYGIVEILPENKGLVVTELFLVPQVCSGAETEMDGTAFLQMVNKWLEDDPEEGYKRNEKCRLWFHSHVSMGAFWSGQDKSQREAFAESGYPWMLSIVANRRGEYKACLDIYQPVHVFMDELNIVVDAQLDEERLAAIKQEIEENVKTRSYATKSYAGNTTTYGGNSSSYGGGYNRNAAGSTAGQQSTYTPYGNGQYGAQTPATTTSATTTTPATTAAATPPQVMGEKNPTTVVVPVTTPQTTPISSTTDTTPSGADGTDGIENDPLLVRMRLAANQALAEYQEAAARGTLIDAVGQSDYEGN